MSLFIGCARNEKDIDVIFSYIYSDLTSIHPSNDPFKIFLQYFQPLFDLTLGLAHIQENIISTGYLSISQENGIKNLIESKTAKEWLLCNECPSVKCIELKKSIHYLNDAKSCLILPIKVEGCSVGNEAAGNRCYSPEKELGSFILYSRIGTQIPIKDICDYLCRYITACFLQQSASREFLDGVHSCLFSKLVCDGSGIGPLNKIGKKYCR